MTRGLLDGGNWWKDGPGYRSAFSPVGRLSCLERHHHYWTPVRDRCAWSLEICREEALKAARYQQLIELLEQDKARWEAQRAARLEAEARYQDQRRQALAAILYGVVIMVLVIAASGG